MTVDLPKWFSIEKLKEKSLEERHTIWRNAKNHNTPQGDVLAKAIEMSGLPYTPKGYLSLDDPRTIAMYAIINDVKNRPLCIQAVKDGNPALAGIEHLIRDALGEDYCGENGMTQTAGDFVANMIRSQGYVDAGQRKMPDGSVAKTARFFTPKS